MSIYKNSVRRKFRKLLETKSEQEACRITAEVFVISTAEVRFMMNPTEPKKLLKPRMTSQELDDFSTVRKSFPKVVFQKQTWLSGLEL